MQSVSSNAVYNAIKDNIVAVPFDTTVNSGYFGVNTGNYNILTDYNIIGISVYYTSGNQNATCFSYSFQPNSSSTSWVYVRMGTSNPPNGTTMKGFLLIAKK